MPGATLPAAPLKTAGPVGWDEATKPVLATTVLKPVP